MPSVSQNSLYLISGSVIQKLLAFIYFIFLARFLGPESVGKYTFAISFVAIFSVFIDIGLNQVLIRETARDQTKVKDYFNNTLTFKLICSTIIYLIIILVVNLLGYPEITKKLVYLAGLVIIIDNLTNTVWAVLRGFRNLKYEGTGLGIYELVVLGVGLVVLLLRLPLPFIICPLILASVVYFIFALFFLIKKYQIKPRWSFDTLIIKQLIKVTLPFFLVGLFGTIFSYIDVVLLSKLGGDKFVGFYSAAGKMPAGLRIIPIAFSSAFYPAACFYFEKNKDELKRITEKIIFYLILFSLPLVAGLWVLADNLINILYGQKFLEAVPALRILVWSILFVSLDYIFLAILNACGQEKKNVFNRGIVMAAIIILNLIFIPLFKHIGSALAFTLSFAILSILGGWMSQKIVCFSVKNILIRFFQILFVSLVMGVIVLLLKTIVSLIPLIAIGAIIYFVGLWIIG
ncbi:MAG: flippase, partial [Minisyncoccia bacterium]